MKYLNPLIALVILTACTEEHPTELLKTTHLDIVRRFSENGTAAELFFQNKSVELTDTINSIPGGGTVVLVDKSMQPYTVNIYSDSYELLAKKKPGDELTVRCHYIDSTLISQCDIRNRPT
jgi:hypothetical protein